MAQICVNYKADSMECKRLIGKSLAMKKNISNGVVVTLRARTYHSPVGRPAIMDRAPLKASTYVQNRKAT